MKKARKITTAEHNDNFGLIMCGMCMGMALLAISHLFVTVVLKGVM